jgi:hypothetical protein
LDVPTERVEQRGYQEGRCYAREGRFFASEGDEEPLSIRVEVAGGASGRRYRPLPSCLSPVGVDLAEEVFARG